MTRVQADGSEQSTLKQAEVAYRSARAEAKGMTRSWLNFRCRSLARQTADDDSVGLAALKALRDELAERGHPVPA